MNDQKPIDIWPGDSGKLIDGAKPVRYVGSALLMGFLGLALGLFLSFVALMFINTSWLPRPPSNQPIVHHFKGYLLAMLELVYPKLDSSSLTAYKSYLQGLSDPLQTAVLRRWGLTSIAGVSCAIWFFLIGFKPTSGMIHLRGKRLLKGREAFADLLLAYRLQAPSGLFIGCYGGYDPRQASFYAKKPSDLVELPEDKRSRHGLYIGGTGRGKTQTIITHMVAPIRHHIRQGEPFKLLIVDTPKEDFSRLFKASEMLRVSPHTKGSLSWNIGTDIYHHLVAQAFWEGVIPANDKDPIWSTSARQMTTGITASLIAVAPNLWNYGMLAHMLMKTAEQLSPILMKHYPEATQVLRSAEQTLSSVMFNVGAYASSFIQLARIHDGFDLKKPICQATAAALKLPDYLDMVADDLMSDLDMPEGIRNMQGLMFKAITTHLNKIQPGWNWIDYGRFLKATDMDKQLAIAKQTLGQFDLLKFSPGHTAGWKKLNSVIVTSAKTWDVIEARPKLKFREWLMNENPDVKVVVLQPSEAFPTLTEGLIRGMLFYANSVILADLKDSKTRKFQILIDELQSNGNIEKFLLPALALYRSRGVGLTLAFQDLSQIEKLYGPEAVQFLTSNVAGIYLMGVNQGTTAEKLSELVGKREVQIRSQSKTSSKDGVSFNESFQKDTAQVITADEINTLLGTKGKEIHYLYLPDGLNPAYVLRNKIIPYEVLYESKPASWISATPIEVKWKDMDKYWNKEKPEALSPSSAEFSELDSLELEWQLEQKSQAQGNVVPDPIV
ncbi:type IV secretory system conjugative DNA transfer family protein [Roseateles sp. PN1]|uniref:type IV secretory system conjugative DNA transfer family protein n=1 Tax=Roseateles sp. PN1 TaxID=3137372 RepID=UPI0031386AB6